jgi:hypothetical protein
MHCTDYKKSQKAIKKQNTIFTIYTTQKIWHVVSRCGKKFPADSENATSLPAFIKNKLFNGF